ncbi:amino acid adenylation domain-containing protein [Caballeronia sp. LZ008]|uniref:non-ribosomal peptide synthetase n=1 Tax=unclassified Caballeronia TaxID=2646786 RepID=UPI002028BFA3|nr:MULTISPECIES: non-ribosomal peptide synthetase [unclassified Caballeronia]MDR5795789.1 amino acid adenylation domain-containing protein [Caballeronia sp. LZ008]
MTSFPTALHLRIKALARLQPDAPALAFNAHDDARLTRGELDARASRLAARLRAAGVGAEVRVGVCVERSCELFVALLAVLKAGGVFVPLDPHHPAARLDWIADDARLAHGIVDRHADDAMRARFTRCFDAEQDIADAPALDDAAPVHPRAAAYMIYTSGSTGTPKAVVVEHGPLAAHCDALVAALRIGEGDSLLHFASVNFDAAHECWLAPLAVGARVVITAPPPFAPEAAHTLIERERVNVAAFPPAYLREFASVAERKGVPASLRVLAFGGEALSREAFARVRREFAAQRLINGYGPTEAVISPMLWPVEPHVTPDLDDADAYASLPIGRVIGPRVARIDDGELLLGGACIARGYHGRAALTAERFVPDASGEPGARIYRTGDLARERADGAYDYLGRIDDQVQIRGVRVEPAEIAACLRAHPSIRDAAVLADSTNGRVQLTACFAPAHEAVSDAALKAYLAEHLPAAWQPHRYVRLARLPYTLNGKLDRDALKKQADRATSMSRDADYIEPATDTERRLAQTWQRILDHAAPIGRADRFFERGGDSLAAMQLQAAIRIDWRVNLRLDTIFDDPPLQALAASIDASEKEASDPVIVRSVVSSDAPYVDRAASFAQQRFWVLAQTRDAGAAYHVAGRWDISGRLDANALQRALDHLIERHEAWRTTLVENEDGVVMQRIHKSSPVTIQRVNHSSNADEERHASEAFDLSNGPLLRATLVSSGDESHRLMLAAHHAITDGYSSRIVFDELAHVYSAYAQGQTPSLAALPIQYADYAQWQRELVAGEEGARQLRFWRKALDAAPEPLALPLDRARPAERDHRGQRVTLRLSADTSNALRQLARTKHASPFVVLLSAFDAWLHRLTGANDFVVATPVAHRQRPETAALIGLCLNTLALRARVDAAQTFSDLMEATRIHALDAFAHQDVPFDRVLDAVKPPVARGDEWLRVKLAQQFDAALTSTLPNASAIATPGPDLAARFDFALDFTDDVRGIELVAAYACDCIHEATARAWLASFATLVADAVRDPSRPIASLDCMPQRDVQRGRALNFEADDILALIAHHASATPHRIALADAHTQISYAELDDASNRIALALRHKGAKAEQAVAVCIERSVRFVVALIGAMKSGAYAVPLDPSMPHARIDAAIDACGARFALVAMNDDNAPRALGNAQLLDVDTLAHDASLANAAVQRVQLAPAQTAYVIFTSGSTGTPKGVAVPHRALADYVQGMLDELAFAPGASMAMVSTVAADLGHTTLFGALCSGRTLHLLPARCAFDPDRFAAEMRVREVGVLKIVPSHLHALLEAQHPADVLPSHALVTGGESLPWALVDRVKALKPSCRVINHYGPTEATVGAIACEASAFADDERNAQSVPLGRPMPNAEAYVFDTSGACVPPGGIGELHIGGPGVARGYLGRAAATAERFMPHPFVRGERLYRTGDRVRLLADGRIAFLGRLDDQVKIRGYRVEPGEVSAALRAIEGVAQAETLPVDRDGRLQLVSFVTGSAQDDSTLRDALGARLPDYMVPATIVMLRALPMTDNGKIDRAALRSIASKPVESVVTSDTPRGDTEEAIASVWQDVLKAKHVGRDDNFFELGGDSILVLQVIARLRKRGLRVTPKQVFDNATVAQLALVAKPVDTNEAKAPVVATKQADGSAALTPAQLRFFALDIPQRGHWNQSVEFDANASFDLDAFARALDALLTHHAIFRQRFERDGTTNAWRIVQASKAFDTLPLAAVAANDETDALAQFDAIQRTLDISHGPLACALVASLADGRTKLYLAIHHLIVDGVSWRILLDDLSSAYQAAQSRGTASLARTGATASQWAARLAAAARDTHSPFAGEAKYWITTLAAGADLRLDHPQAKATNADAAVIEQTLEVDLTRAVLADANLAYRTQTIELLIAALAHATGATCRMELEGHGREPLFDDIDASRTLGWLTSHYPVSIPVLASPIETLAAAKDTLRAVPNKGLGFGVLRHFGDDATRASLEALPRPRVTFNYLGQFDSLDSRDAAFTPRFGGAGCERDPSGPLGNALAIHAYVADGAERTLRLHWVYGATQFERATIEALAQRFEGTLADIVAACAGRIAMKGAGATPGDFPLARDGGLTQAALERLPVDLRSIADIYPLSPMQQGILFHSLFAPEQSTYVNQFAATLIAPDIDRLRAAFEASVPRHDILRTGFTADEAAPMQIVHRQAGLPFDVIDWRERSDASAAFETWLADDRARGFDLAAPPLMRVTLIRVTDDEWRIVWTRHHLLLDGWSTARMFADVLRDYIEPPRAQPFVAHAKTRYRDFIEWLATRDAQADQAFWTDRLARLGEPTRIAQREASKAPTLDDHRSWRASLDPAMTARLTEAARRLRVTLNTLVQGAWALVLQRMTHQASVAYGATVAGRPDSLADIDGVLGLFINTLPVIAEPLPQRAASAWLRELQADNAAAHEHAHTPLADIQRWAGQGGGALFDTLVVFENYPVDEAWAGRDERALKMRALRNIEATDFALTLVVEAGEAIVIDYGYDAARLDESRVAALHRALSTCLDAFATNPDGPLGTIALADDVARFNATARAWSDIESLPLHRQFERMANAAPDAIALEMIAVDGIVNRITYAQLNERANRVAAALLAAGVAHDTAVALCVERSFDMVVALFGVLKAGAAYLPIDPDYPADRIAYLLDDAKPAVVLTQTHLRARVESVASTARVFDVDALMQGDATLTASIDITDAHLAYLIYTSGSTGKPKGAGNTHGALANRIAWMQDAYRLTRDDVVLHKTPFGFDVSVWEFVWPLATGAKLAIAAPGDHRDPARLVAAIEAHRVSTLHFVPSMLAAFVAHIDEFGDAKRCASIERIVASGEALAPELVARVARLLPNARLHNLYGPTEAAIDVSHWTCSADDIESASVPIGHPIANLQLHVLDAVLHPVAAGGIGELYLGGAGLARGYLGRASLTAERFVPDPFVAGARLYRTGDLARRRDDGALDYLGRIDTQVKLRGQRIEPGEIEALLRAEPDVRDAVVIVRDEQLIGYVSCAASETFDESAVLNSLRSQLPAYMVPARVMALDALPVTPNGKCDRNALPAPARTQRIVTAARTQTERELAAIWQRVLRVEAIGRDDDFFTLGGHSLLATQANAQANLHWSLTLPLRTLFDERTLARCAAAIDAALASRDEKGGAHDAASVIDALLDELETQ